MQLSLLSGRSHPALARAVGARLGIEPAGCQLETFPDDELYFRSLDPLLGHDVYLIQPTSPPAAQHLLELLPMADGCRRAGAARITAVVPYFGYARQDRRTEAGQAVGAKLAADLISTRCDRIITLDLHAPVAYVHKERFSGDEVRVRHITGQVKNRIPILIDDMISTGGTILSALDALRAQGCRIPAKVVAVHALLVADAAGRLAEHPIDEVVATNSIRRSDPPALPFRSIDIAGLLADAIRDGLGSHLNF